jgi:hypothetical protein
MATKKGSSVRFDKLVQESGSPEAATLWTKPEQNSDFMAAVKCNRVVTVHQENVGTKKDFGTIGFSTEKNASYLIFPKKLLEAAETKVIGIKYEKLSQKPPRDPVRRERVRPDKSSRKSKKAIAPAVGKAEKSEKHSPSNKEEKPLYRFKSTVQLKTEQSLPIEVDAHSSTEARELIAVKAQELKIDPTATKLMRKVGPIRKAGKRN